MIITKLDDTSKKKTNEQRNRVGNRCGRADYDESIELNIEGDITAASPWTQKLSAELTLTNTIAANHLQQTTSGKTLIDEVKRSRGREDWVGISIQAEMLPNYA
jgi:hypothetical protein